MPDLFLELRNESGNGSVTPAPLTEDEALALLNQAEFSGSRLIPWGSNYSFAVAMETDDGWTGLAIYKPRAGEAPLYDFPDGTLYQRELAAYLFSRWARWDLVPPTVIRDGPHGEGSVQLYIEPDAAQSARDEFWGSRRLDIERLVLFDHLINNADRKITHCLRDTQGKIWGIDHGLTFNHDWKLRTALWQFVGEPISPTLRAELAELCTRAGELRGVLDGVLTGAEVEALIGRMTHLSERGTYPVLNPRRNVPYGWW